MHGLPTINLHFDSLKLGFVERPDYQNLGVLSDLGIEEAGALSDRLWAKESDMDVEREKLGFGFGDEAKDCWSGVGVVRKWQTGVLDGVRNG
ncbi:unnamed protein product [Ilex paraguariensis]|uniref:Uncharacterized protein n=1 Tax=Ilex paraguariensis TaxID=185542 RepID=A0ABC8UJN7_9AQUA